MNNFISAVEIGFSGTGGQIFRYICSQSGDAPHKCSNLLLMMAAAKSSSTIDGETNDE